jgi:hypothetical protein
MALCALRRTIFFPRSPARCLFINIYYNMLIISTQFNLVMLVIAGARAVRVSHKCDEKPPAAAPLIVNLFWPAPAHGKFNGSFFRMLIRLQRCWARADKRREKTRRWKLAYSSETKNLIVPNSVLCHCCARV